MIIAVLLLIWNGSAFFARLRIAGDFGPGIRIASTALTLNVALILFGWRRYVDLQHEAELRVEQPLGPYVVGQRAAYLQLSTFAEAAGKHVDVNAVLLEQALINVIENAVQHSPAGAPIRASVEEAGSHVRLSIEDEGSGIAPEERERVFDKFFRGGGDRRRHSGVGLGLSVTRGLIESFGGR